MIHEKTSFIALMTTISFQLKIDGSLKNIHEKYIIQRNSTTMKIHNDMSVKLFLEILKHSPFFGMFLLCINTIDIVIGDGIFDADIGAIKCHEAVESGGHALL